GGSPCDVGAAELGSSRLGGEGGCSAESAFLCCRGSSGGVVWGSSVSVSSCGSGRSEASGGGREGCLPGRASSNASLCPFGWLLDSVVLASAPRCCWFSARRSLSSGWGGSGDRSSRPGSGS